jgi:serine/threonine protein kinase
LLTPDRDLKPENLLLRDLFDDSGILLADFGFARYVPEEKLTTRCGTPAFVAPEVLVADCRYDESCDMWSVGCLLYMLLGGYPPFQDKNHRGLFRKIRGADFCFHDAYWKNVSISAKQLISSLLTVDPAHRCTAKMALEKSTWLKLGDLSLSGNDLSASLGEIKKFQARQQLKGAMHAVRWSIRAKFMSGDTAGFLKQIKTWDKNDEATQGSRDSLLTEDRPTLKFADVYELQEKIHTGKSSTIWECIRKQGGEKLAVKVVERVGDPTKSATGKSAAETVLHEVAVLKSLKHKYIIDIIDFFDEDDSFYLVMERMEGGDVFDRIMDMKQYTEKDARDLSRFLIEAVACMHQSGIAHRDLKPQNLLLKSKEDNSDIKIADFGFACKVHTPQSLTTRCGTSFRSRLVLRSLN